MIELIKLQTLTQLSLAQTAITDSSAPDLARLKSLTSLDLAQTRTTEQSTNTLRKSLPKCAITP